MMAKSFPVLFGGILFLFFACNHAKVTAQNENSFDVLYQSEYGGNGVEETQLIDDQSELASFWSQTVFEYGENIPKIDFTQNTVIVQHFPSRNSGGSSYRVDSVSYEGNLIRVNYTVNGPSGMVTTAITNPLIVLKVKKIENPKIEFINSNQN